MSVSEFSSFLQDKILDRLTKRLRATKLSDIASYSTENIREATNKKASGYEAVLSRGNLKDIAEQFNNETRFKANSEFKKVSKIATQVSDLEYLSISASKILSNVTLFDNFVQYLSNGEQLSFEKSKKGQLHYSNIQDDIKYGIVKPGTLSDRDILILKETHGDLAKQFRTFLEQNYSGISTESRVLDFIKEQLDAGHLVGVFNIRLKRILGLRNSASKSNDIFAISSTKTNNDELTVLLNSINSLLVQADYLSSNTILNPDMFVVAEKRVYQENPSVTVELQLSLKNKDAGNKLAAMSRSLNDLIKAVRGEESKARGRIDKQGAVSSLKKFLGHVSKLAEANKEAATALINGVELPPEVLSNINSVLVNTNTIEKMIGARGSDSLIESVENTIAAVLQGKSIPTSQNTKAQAKHSGNKKATVLANRLQPTSKSTSKPIKANVTSTSKSINTLNLSNLQNLLNQRLHDAIKQNMGTGSDTKVLNYHQGRFAESVKIEQMSQGRTGMITAFYSYMKNPYGTFSSGGRQEYPRSRDPKLLISKSIREIAGSQVANRLRAVNV